MVPTNDELIKHWHGDRDLDNKTNDNTEMSYIDLTTNELTELLSFLKHVEHESELTKQAIPILLNYHRDLLNDGGTLEWSLIFFFLTSDFTQPSDAIEHYDDTNPPLANVVQKLENYISPQG